jgi:hypothetical protein
MCAGQRVGKFTFFLSVARERTPYFEIMTTLEELQQGSWWGVGRVKVEEGAGGWRNPPRLT